MSLIDTFGFLPLTYNSPVAGPLGRSAYMGRNWEGFSADPYLTGVAMTETITGLQVNFTHLSGTFGKVLTSFSGCRCTSYC